MLTPNITEEHYLPVFSSELVHMFLVVAFIADNTYFFLIVEGRPIAHSYLHQLCLIIGTYHISMFLFYI